MILRVLRGRVHPGQIAVFREQAQQTLDDARQHDGLIYAQVGRQVHSDGGEEVIFVSAWRDLEALYRWLGGTDLLKTPVLANGRADHPPERGMGLRRCAIKRCVGPSFRVRYCQSRLRNTT